MTVNELIEELRKYDGDMRVVTTDHVTRCYQDIELKKVDMYPSKEESYEILAIKPIW